MTAKDLKNALLQEAVQGKLVPQIASEGNARDLLEEIRKEKLSHGLDFANAKSGKRKSKKETALAGSNPCDITEDEIPFDIPENWCWCRLGELVYNHGQKTPEQEFSYIDIGSINNEHQKLNEKENFIQPDKAPSRARKIVKFGDVIYSTVRPYLHNMCIIDKEFTKEPIASTGFAVMTSFPGLLNKYLFYYLLSPTFDNYANDTDNAKGVAYPAINDDKLYKGIVPLPPLSEQKRIVAAIEKFMPLIEEYGKKETQLKAINEKIGKLTKKAILQEAVQGKLVPQIASEGNARDLLEEIRNERFSHGFANSYGICDGKDKKSKSSDLRSKSQIRVMKKELPEITEDEIPFEIQESWCWCRLGEIVQLTSGQDLQPEMYNSSQKGIPYITGASNFNNGNVIINRWTETPKSVAIKDDLLLTCKGTVGEMAFLREKKVHIARQVMSIRSSENISLGYVKIYLTTQIENLKSKAKSMIPGIAREDVISSLIPLPPLAEQKRIVRALEAILPVIDEYRKKEEELARLILSRKII